MYKKYFVFVLILLFSACSIPQKNISQKSVKFKVSKDEKFIYERPAISKELLNTIHNIIEDMISYNLIDINKKYVSSDFGLYNVSKIEGLRTFTFQKEIYNIVDSSTDEFSHFIKRIDKNTNKKDIQVKNVSFDCSPNNDAFYGWNHYGAFISSKTKPYLSTLMKKENSISPNKYGQKDLHKAKVIEKMSYEIVITPEIVFYLSPIKNKWYITLIDRISTDCSSPK